MRQNLEKYSFVSLGKCVWSLVGEDERRLTPTGYSNEESRVKKSFVKGSCLVSPRKKMREEKKKVNSPQHTFRKNSWCISCFIFTCVCSFHYFAKSPCVEMHHANPLNRISISACLTFIENGWGGFQKNAKALLVETHYDTTTCTDTIWWPGIWNISF